MCTVSWVRESGGYTLCMNRDESRARAAAAAPSVLGADGVRFLAPVDGERGGSWVAVNEQGVTVCILNRYDLTSKTRSARPSRGELILQLASCFGREEVERRLWARDLSSYQAFSLMCLEPGQPALVVDWTGGGLIVDACADDRAPLVSSSKVQENAARARGELFARFRAAGLGKATLIDFHASHEPARGALSPCMHREDAATVSFTVVEVSDTEVRMTYQSGSPCEGGTRLTRCLPREVARDGWAA